MLNLYTWQHGSSWKQSQRASASKSFIELTSLEDQSKVGILPLLEGFQAQVTGEDEQQSGTSAAS